MEDLMASKAWRAVTSGVSTTTSAIPASAWRTPLARHLKLEHLLDGGDNSRMPDASENPPDDAQDKTKGEEEQGHTHPLHVAASQNIYKLGRLLLHQQHSGPTAGGTYGCVVGVDPNVRDSSGRTALHWAAMTDRTCFMRLLLESGAAIDAVDSQDRTPLLSGAAFGASGAVRLLLSRGADVSKASSRGGLTPLHAAAAGGHFEAAQALIAAGADVRRRSDMGAEPRHLAERQGHADVVQLLLAASERPRLLSATAASATGGRQEQAERGWWVGGWLDACRNEGDVGGREEEDVLEQRREMFAQFVFDRESLLQRPRSMKSVVF